jgi:hypothetical protein
MLNVNLVAHNGCRNHGQIPQLLMKMGKKTLQNGPMFPTLWVGIPKVPQRVPICHCVGKTVFKGYKFSFKTSKIGDETRKL